VLKFGFACVCVCEGVYVVCACGIYIYVIMCVWCVVLCVHARGVSMCVVFSERATTTSWNWLWLLHRGRWLCSLLLSYRPWERNSTSIKLAHALNRSQVS